jgi:hypothetical protein
VIARLNEALRTTIASSTFRDLPGTVLGGLSHPQNKNGRCNMPAADRAR